MRRGVRQARNENEAHVESRKDMYPGNVRITYAEDMVELNLPLVRGRFRSSALAPFGSLVVRWRTPWIAAGPSDYQVLEPVQEMAISSASSDDQGAESVSGS